MAYFLDPELDALTTGKPRRSPRRAPEKVKAPNKFGKSCHSCGHWVNAGAGYRDQVSGGWVVYCSTCP